MTSRTAQRKAAPAKAAPPIEEPKAEEPKAPAWATKDSLGEDEPWEDAVLPSLEMQVRIRYLDTPEVMRMQYLPDYADYLSLAVEISKDVLSMEPNEMADLAEKTGRYQAMVAHLSVMDPDQIAEKRDCESCGFAHTPSLWGVRQASRLSPMDLDFITGTALRMKDVMPVVPFSEDPTLSDTPSPASSGESIPPTS